LLHSSSQSRNERMGMIQRQVSTASLCEALAYDFERTPSGHLDVKPAINEVKKVLYSCRSRMIYIPF